MSCRNRIFRRRIQIFFGNSSQGQLYSKCFMMCKKDIRADIFNKLILSRKIHFGIEHKIHQCYKFCNHLGRSHLSIFLLQHLRQIQVGNRSKTQSCCKSYQGHRHRLQGRILQSIQCKIYYETRSRDMESFQDIPHIEVHTRYGKQCSQFKKYKRNNLLDKVYKIHQYACNFQVSILNIRINLRDCISSIHQDTKNRFYR